MSSTLTRDRFNRPRKPRGAVLEPVILHAEVVQIPVKRGPVRLKPHVPFWKTQDCWLGVTAIAACVALIARFG